MAEVPFAISPTPVGSRLQAFR
ncbi:unnamed protein product [Victoria cruziana]